MPGIDSLSDNERAVLRSLLDDGRKPDAAIAEDTGLSVSTVNRLRRDLEERGVIEEYLPIFNVESDRLRFFVSIRMVMDEEIDTEEPAASSHVMFVGETDSFDQEIVIFAGFDDYDTYQEFIDEMKQQYRDKTSSFQHSVVTRDRATKATVVETLREQYRRTLQD